MLQTTNVQATEQTVATTTRNMQDSKRNYLMIDTGVIAMYKTILIEMAENYDGCRIYEKEHTRT